MREALSRKSSPDRAPEAVSREHQVCPFELSLDVSLWVDAIICDYNYAFDPGSICDVTSPSKLVDMGLPMRLTTVDRAREMFSADLKPGD
jgi:hypothetical protein